MGGDDELGVRCQGLVQELHECQLSQGGERRFGFIEQVQAAGPKTRLKQLQVTFAMGGCAQTAFPVLLFQRFQFAGIGHARQPTRLGRTVSVFHFGALPILHQLFVHRRQSLDIAEEILSTQEKANSGAPVPDRFELVGQLVDGLQGGVGMQRCGTDSRQTDDAGQRFQDGGFAAAVVTHQEGQRGAEFQGSEFLQDGQ